MNDSEFPFSNVEPCGSLESEVGEFDIYLSEYAKYPGRWGIYFHNRDLHKGDWNDPRGNKFPRCGFRVYPEAHQLIFLGMLLPQELRGKRLSLPFMKSVAALAVETGYKFERTGIIKKPSISRRLLDWGFLPESEEGEVEILPRRMNENGVPRVNFLNPEMAENVPFYTVVDEGDLSAYPLTNPDRSRVFLNTRFWKPDDFCFDDVPVTFSDSVKNVLGQN